MHKKLLGPGGPLGVFHEYPVLLRLACISVCAEIAWATMIAVLEYHFKDNLLLGEAEQFIASRVAMALLAFTACETIFKVPMGALSDRIGPRPVVLFALSIATVPPLLAIVAPEWYYFLPLRAINGLAAAALWPSMSALMARAVPREAKSAAMSVFNGAYCMGVAIGPVTGLYLGHLVSRYRGQPSNQFVFPLCSLLMIIGVLIARSVLRGGLGSAPPAAASAVNDVAGSAATSESDAPHHIGENFPQHEGSLLRGRPMLLKMMVIYAVSQTAVGILATVLPIYLAGHQFNIQQGDLPRLIALPAVVVGFVALPLGRLADAMGRARAVWVSYASAAVGMLLVASTSLPEIYGLGHTVGLAIFGLGMVGLVTSFILGTPAWLGLTSLQVDDARQAHALSLMQTAQGVGVVAGLGAVASAGHLLTQWTHFKVHVKTIIAQHSHHAVIVVQDKVRTESTVPISVWLWTAVGVFALCLIGTLLFVREPEHPSHAVAQQPLEITGV